MSKKNPQNRSLKTIGGFNMFVQREVDSIKNLQKMLAFLHEQKKESKLKTKTDTQQSVLDLRIVRLQSQVATFTDAEKAYQKLSHDLESALDDYETNCPKHAEQRTLSISRMREWLKILQANVQTAAEKHLALAKSIVRELNSVEGDHNKSTFSFWFTESRLARVYMNVLRGNCINPNDEKYLPIEEKTVVREDDEAKLIL